MKTAEAVKKEVAAYIRYRERGHREGHETTQGQNQGVRASGKGRP